jgi:hypothetical protein
MSKPESNCASRPGPPYLSRDTGQVEAYDDAVRYMNRRGLNHTGYGYCPAHGGYHTWQMGKYLGCTPSPRREHLN